MIGDSILELHETNATDESIKFYKYDEYQLMVHNYQSVPTQLLLADWRWCVESWWYKACRCWSHCTHQ